MIGNRYKIKYINDFTRRGVYKPAPRSEAVSCSLNEVKKGVRRCLIKRFPVFFMHLHNNHSNICQAKVAKKEGLVRFFFDENEWVDLHYKKCDRGNVPLSIF